MGLNLGPAVGARSQIGFAEEGKWGKQEQAPTGFIEMVSEGIVSEIGSLVSNSLRSDRAVHKRVGGTEACGGDVNCEIGPSGFETWFKHALGSVATTRLDTAFIIECTDSGETGAVLTITHTAGVATLLTVAFTVNSGDDVSLDLTNASYDTLIEVMAAINANPHLAAWSPYQAIQGVWQTTLHASDYCAGTDGSSRLEATANIDIIKAGSIPNGRLWTVGTLWGCYQHVIDAASTLPEGMSVEVGRDVASFMYAGMKVNTLELNASPGDFYTGTFGLMGKGGTTAALPVAATANTKNEKNALKMKYTGANATATMTIDHTNKNLVLAVDGTSEDLTLNLAMPYVDPETGVVYSVDKIGGLVDYLDALSFIDCEIMDYVDPKTLSSYLKAAVATDIHSSSFVVFNFDSTDIVSLPVLWGDYIGSDEGDPVTFYVKVLSGAVPGTATLQFQKSAGGYGNTATSSATVVSEVRTDSNVDSGYTVFFPDNTALITGDIWTFSTIRDAATATYSTIDPFSGYEGALTLDGSSQSIMGWTATITNNLFGDKYHLGKRTRAKLPEQKRTVEGTLTVEFDNLDLYRRFLNGTQGNIIMIFTSPSYITDTVLGDSSTQYSLTVRQPEIEFNGTTPVTADEGIITVEMPYVALYDDTNSIPEIRITIVSDVAYI